MTLANDSTKQQYLQKTCGDEADEVDEVNTMQIVGQLIDR